MSAAAVTTFYRFVRIVDLEALRTLLQSQCEQLGLRGTILLAGEGINGSLAGPQVQLQRFQQLLRADRRFADVVFRSSDVAADNPVFDRLKIRIKPEIVALGRPDIDPEQGTGRHVDAVTWNALLDEPDVLVIDARNSFEVEMGSFPGAIDPGTSSFRQFTAFVSTQLDPGRHRRIAMFCTGGIRCEKAAAYMLQAGFDDVVQLEGGILNYLETTPINRWRGDCFVFDQRVAVGAGAQVADDSEER